MKMDKCWASSLGDCSGKISGEHIISENLLKAVVVDSIQEKSLDNKVIRTMSPASFKAKILCWKHNSGLLNLDSNITQTLESIRKFGGVNNSV